MISQIHLQKIATYEDAKLDHLSRVNFVYGPNGSGKSTISRQLKEFPTRSATDSHENFSIQPEEFIAEIVVFDETLVKNLFTAGPELEPVYTSIENLENQQIIDKKQKELTQKVAQKESYKISLEKVIASNKKHKDELQILIKGLLPSIKPLSIFKLYQGYKTSPTLNDYVINNWDKIERSTDQQENLSIEFDKLTDQSLTSAMQPPSVNAPDIDWDKLGRLLNTPILPSGETEFSKFYSALDNAEWVQKGIEYHDSANDRCPFCAQETSQQIKDNINSFFDQTYRASIEFITRCHSEIQTYSANLQSEHHSLQLSFSPELYNAHLDSINTILKAINELIKALEIKLSSPRQLFSLVFDKGYIDSYHQSWINLDTEIKRIRSAQANLNSDKAALFIRSINCFLTPVYEPYQHTYEAMTRAKTGIDCLNTKIEIITDEISVLKGEISNLNSKMSDIGETVDAINHILAHSGFDTFKLEAEFENKTYKVLRHDSTDTIHLLSEGERTFLTFLHFYQSLKDTGRDNPIICVIDDPISSLDQQCLSIVSSLVKKLNHDIISNSCRPQIVQSIILSHNPYFIQAAAPMRKGDNGNYSHYVISKLGGRQSTIKRHEYNPIVSPYSMLWRETFRDDVSPVLVANGMRRILENYFVSYSGRSLHSLIEGLGLEEPDFVLFQSLFLYLNRDSHVAYDGFMQAPSEVDVGRAKKLFQKIFELHGQGQHYEMMMQSVEMTET